MHDQQQPEAVYFADDGGQRCGYLFIDMAEASQIANYAEPWFRAFNAQIEFHPVMAPADLAKTRPAIEQAVARFNEENSAA